MFNDDCCLLHLKILVLISNLYMGSRGSAKVVELDTDGAKEMNELPTVGVFKEVQSAQISIQEQLILQRRIPS